MSIGDFLGKIGEYTSSKEGQGLMNLAGLGLTGYGMYRQNKNIQKQNDLMQRNYEYNKALNDRALAQQNMNQENFTSSFNDIFNQKEKKKGLGSFTGAFNFQG